MEGAVAFSLNASPTLRSPQDSRRAKRSRGYFLMRCSDELPSTSVRTRTILPQDSQTTTISSRS